MPLWIFSVWFSCGTGRIISIIFLLVVSCAELLAARCMATAQCGRTQNNRRRFASGDGRSTPSAFSAQEWNEMWGERDVFVSFQHIRDRIKFHGRYLYATEIWVVRRVYVEKKRFPVRSKKNLRLPPLNAITIWANEWPLLLDKKEEEEKLENLLSNCIFHSVQKRTVGWDEQNHPVTYGSNALWHARCCAVTH